MKLSCTAKRLIRIFPNRFESSLAKDSSDFGRGTFVADLELPGGKGVDPGVGDGLDSGVADVA